MTLRLLIVTRENEQDRAYGLGKTLQPIADALSRRGHQVEYFCKMDCQDAHIKWHERFSHLLSYFNATLAPAIAERLVQGIAAVRKALSEKSTHVWVHDPWLVWGVKLGLKRFGYWREQPFKLIVSEHGLGSFAWAVTQDGLPMSDRLYRALLKQECKILLSVDAVFTPSDTARKALVRDLCLSQTPAHFHVMGYGKPEINLPNKSEACAHFGLAAAHAPIILGIGRLTPVKRFDLLIDAAAILQQQYQLPVQILIAGGGDPAPLLQQAEKHTLQLKPIIQFESNIAWPLAAADLYVSTCAYESYGQANREAVAAGVATLAPSSGGSAEVLGIGACLQPLSANNIAAAIADILQNPGQQQYWQTKALEESKHWPTWNQLSEDYERLLLSL
ncbi:Glycosyltransferase involved in cell wall bisynthesis [Oceanospirillum multiglobuliferum]|uniref:Glycosyltransferase subfamily 4-like N-terminal domain-containing protein n=1 Tax=Oceanospirillum multiglobuliferum TaxID=64969 RepID=A0A1T4Q7E6_9GAMM|nr:glycosyltransferase family 4 protein [Oceanospirillum multiglobuliferum]OPX56588.1 hypothetical protein BTE48_03980 [Oceanospirillum multiglobuliferum]SJZ99692.1 Glycosyltransferase involved in cell wall bisynthesis [Oceanospirillum multiglobuliferum]